MEDLQKLLDEERLLSEFRHERWMNAEARIEAVWNQAVSACREKLGQHTPPCDPGEAMPCNLCWQNAKLASLMLLDRSGYVTIRERIELERIKIAHDKSLENNDQWPGIIEGAARMASAASKLFGEKE